MPDLCAGGFELLAHRRQQTVPEHRLKIYFGLVEIAPVTFHPYPFDGRPAFELTDSRADAGLADAKFRRNVVQTKSGRAEIEQGIDLADDAAESKRLGRVPASLDELASRSNPLVS